MIRQPRPATPRHPPGAHGPLTCRSRIEALRHLYTDLPASQAEVSDQPERVCACTSAPLSADHRCRHRDTAGSDDQGQTAGGLFSCVSIGVPTWMRGRYSSAGIRRLQMKMYRSVTLLQTLIREAQAAQGGGSSRLSAGPTWSLTSECPSIQDCFVARIAGHTQLSGHTGGSGLRATAVVDTRVCRCAPDCAFSLRPALPTCRLTTAAGLHSPCGRAGTLRRPQQQRSEALTGACTRSARARCWRNPNPAICAHASCADKRPLSQVFSATAMQCQHLADALQRQLVQLVANDEIGCPGGRPACLRWTQIPGVN